MFQVRCAEFDDRLTYYLEHEGIYSKAFSLSDIFFMDIIFFNIEQDCQIAANILNGTY